VTHPAEAATFDEIEQKLEADKTQSAAQSSEALAAKLEGDGIPEAFRGKTVKEIMTLAAASQNALSISENARKDAEERARSTAAAPAVSSEPTKPPEPEFGEKEFRKLYEEDPAAAFLRLSESTEKRMAKNFEGRLVPLVASSTSAAEAEARRQYSEDFQLFDADIEKFIQTQLGGDRSRVSTVKAWTDLVTYIRGQPPNIEKLFEHRRKKSEDEARKTAEERQQAVTGFSGTAAARRTSTEGGGEQLDATEKAIAQEFIRSGLIKDESEYSRWKKVS
jgi:hypothetical protein